MTETTSYYKKVASVTVTDGGSGYTSAPTVTISGNATATATVSSGKVTAITLTSAGYNYLSPPTITFSGGSGSGAAATANMVYIDDAYNGFKQSLSHLIANQLPDFVRVEYPVFITFLEKYYEFLDEENQVNNFLLNYEKNFDINRTLDTFLPKFKNQYAQNFPLTAQIDDRRLIKFIKQFYEAKGSEKAIELLFRILYNERTEIFYPSEQVLRASDGIWIEDITLKLAVDSSITANPFDLNSKTVKITYYENVSSVTYERTVETNISNVTKFAYVFPAVYELVTSLPKTARILVPGAGASANALVSGGQVKAIVGDAYKEFNSSTGVNDATNIITINSHGYSTGDIVIYTRGTGHVVGGLTEYAIYYVIVVNSNQIKLALSANNATLGTGINIAPADPGNNRLYEPVTDGGNGYFAAPAVQFTSATGTSATARTILTDTGEISHVIVTNGGSGYSTAPAVTFSTEAIRTKVEIVSGTTTTLYGYVVRQLSTVDVIDCSGTPPCGFSVGDIYSIDESGSVGSYTVEFNSGTTGTLAATVAVSGTEGQFTCGPSTLAVNSTVTITGTRGGTGTITGYTTGTVYKVSAVTGVSPNVTGFTLTTSAGSIITTTPGTLTGLTYVTTTSSSSGYFLNKYNETDTTLNPYTLVGRDNKASIRIDAIDVDGCPTAVSIFDTGFDFERESFTVDIESALGCTATLSFTTGAVNVKTGRFRDSRGMLSNVNKLQDNFYYQNYSYVVRSNVPSNKWLDIVKNTTHPAGTAIFGELTIEQTVDFNQFITTPIQPLHIYEFVLEELSADTFYYAVNFRKVLTDSATVAEANSSHVFKVLADAATVADITTLDFTVGIYGTEDDTTETLDVFDRVVQYVREVNETTITAENAITDFDKVLQESIFLQDPYAEGGFFDENYVAADTTEFDFAKVLAEAATTSEANVFAVSKVITPSYVTPFDNASALYGTTFDITKDGGLYTMTISINSEGVITIVSGFGMPFGYYLSIGGTTFEHIAGEDAVIATESFTRTVEYYRTFAESVITHEYTSAGIERPGNDEAIDVDEANATETSFNHLYKSLTDSVTSTDTIGIIPYLVKTDDAGATELLIVANDSETIESIAATEQSLLDVLKGIFETVAVTEDGIINVQNYIEGDFGSDYVGQSMTFAGTNSSFPVPNSILNLDAGNSLSYSGTGTTWTDMSGGDHSGTLTNGPTYSSADGGSIVFDGTNDYVQCSGSLTTSAATFIVWIKRNGPQDDYDGIMYSRSATATGLTVYGTTNKLSYTWNNAINTYQWDSGLLIPDSTWCMVAVSVTSTSAKAYLCQSSGITSATNTVSHTSTTLDDIKIGWDDLNSSRFFKGNIGVAMIYDRALSDAEITQNFTALRGRFDI
jgi:hypothetical protein